MHHPAARLRAKAQGISRRRPVLTKSQRVSIAGWLCIMPWLIGFILFTVGPALASLYFSLTEWALVDTPRFVGLRNFQDLALRDRRFWQAVYNTLYYAFFMIPLSRLLAFFMALLLNQQVYGTAVFRTILYIPEVVAGVGSMLLWMWLLHPQGLLNAILARIGLGGIDWLSSTLWAKPSLILMGLWSLGNTMVIYLAGLQGVPVHLYDAAEVDGAGAWSRLRYVTIPQMTPTIFLTLVMGTIGALQVFTAAYLMTDGGPGDSTLFYLLYLYRHAFHYFRMGYASAMAWVLFVTILILTAAQLVLSRRWVYYEYEG